MAIVSKQEFADLCGDNVNHLSVYLGRKKVLWHNEQVKTLDTKNPINAAYIKKRKEANASKKEIQQTINRIPPATTHRQGRPPAGDTDEDDLPPPLDENLINAYLTEKRHPRDSEGESMAKWIKLKMKGDAELVTLRVEKEQLLLDKAAGKLVPIDVAADVLRSQAKTIFVNFENAIENIATVFCNIMAGGDIGMYTRIVEASRKELHVAITRAGVEANGDLDTILANYTEGRANKL